MMNGSREAPGLYICGAPVLWFDYELAEKDFMRGFVCDAHKVSNRLEKLAVKKDKVTAAALAASPD